MLIFKIKYYMFGKKIEMKYMYDSIVYTTKYKLQNINIAIIILKNFEELTSRMNIKWRKINKLINNLKNSWYEYIEIQQY